MERAEVAAYSGLAPVVFYVRFVFVSEVFDCRKYRVRGCLPETAERCRDNVLAEIQKGLYVSLFPIAIADISQNIEHYPCTDPAGSTFTAGFFGREFEEKLRGADHACVFVHDDHSARTDDRAGLVYVFICDRDIEQLFGDTSA